MGEMMRRKSMVLVEWKRKDYFDFGKGIARERNKGDQDLIPRRVARSLAPTGRIEIVDDEDPFEDLEVKTDENGDPINPFSKGVKHECGC